MRRVRRAIAVCLIAVMASLPLPGCAAGAPNPVGSLANLALSVGASVGAGLLIKSLTD